MCLVACRIAPEERFAFVLASNRDEFFARPAAALSWWPVEPGGAQLLGGRDLAAGGSWLALRREGAAVFLALVTNVRNPSVAASANAASRGALVASWLKAPHFDETRLRALAAEPRNGFNLLLVALHEGRAAWVGNQPVALQMLTPKMWGLSNAALDTPWPKVEQLKARLAETITAAATPAAIVNGAFAALADPAQAADDKLPATGIPLERERQLSSAFIRIAGPSVGLAHYGTRCSTVVVAERVVGAAGRGLLIEAHERRFDATGAVAGDSVERFSAVAG